MIPSKSTSTRFLSTALLVLLLTVTGAFAKQNSDNGKGSDKESGAASSGTDKKPEAAPGMEERLRALEQIIERQQREIEALRGMMEKRNAEVVAERKSETSSTETVALKSASEAKPPEAPEADTATQPAAAQQKSGDFTLPAGLKISGDLRFRGETFANQGFDSPAEAPFRGRLRVRARLGIEGKINDHFTWGMRLATNIFTDPISSNQTLTDFFERKPFALERMFIKYDTKTDKIGLELIAGKFEPTFRRTQMIWDDDLNVEGASEAIYFKTDSPLSQIKLVAFQLPFNEVSAGKDGILYGGQAQTDWNLSSKVTARVDIAYYDWVRADQVLRGLGASATQVNGGISNGSGITGGQNGALGTTNRLIVSNGVPVGFLANFNLLDILGTLTWKASDRFPLTITLDYVRNLSDRIDDENNGYWAGIQIGRNSKKDDWLFGYTFTRIQQDAVLVPFNFSDILASNSRAHIPTIGYRVADKVLLQWTGLYSQRVNRIFPLSGVNRFLNRNQFDVIYQF